MMYTIHMSVAGYYGGPEVPNRTFFLKQTFLFKSLILKTKFFYEIKLSFENDHRVTGQK